MQTLLSATNTGNLNTDTIEQRIAQERIRQAHNTSNLALVATGIATTLSIIGAIAFFLSGKPTAGTLTTTGGSLISIHSIRLAKDANDRLDKLIANSNEIV